MRIRHLWYHAGKAGRSGWRGAFLIARPCDPDGTVAKLSAVPQPDLGWFARVIAFLTTPFKFLGISGWVDTGCSGHGRGRLIRDARHSTDGFWTLDVALESFTIGEKAAPYGRFLRLECEPGTEAHRVCEETRLESERDLGFGGPIVFDTDGPFLEIHPDLDFQIIEARESHEVESHEVTKSKVIKSQSRKSQSPESICS